MALSLIVMMTSSESGQKMSATPGTERPANNSWHCAGQWPFGHRLERILLSIHVCFHQAELAMPSTYLGLHYHLVFSTKNRVPWIDAAWRERLHDYLGGTINGLGGFSQQVGSVADHVHLLVGLKATHCLADVLRELKKASSVWVHEQCALPEFAWQEGYSAFTVSPTARDGVRRYIANQEQHHRRRTYREELIDLLQSAAVEFDERYLD
jgi:putative transposase